MEAIAGVCLVAPKIYLNRTWANNPSRFDKGKNGIFAQLRVLRKYSTMKVELLGSEDHIKNDNDQRIMLANLLLVT